MHYLQRARAQRALTEQPATHPRAGVGGTDKVTGKVEVSFRFVDGRRVCLARYNVQSQYFTAS